MTDKKNIPSKEVAPPNSDEELEEAFGADNSDPVHSDTSTERFTEK